jgi:hypothetical protein
VRLGAGQEKTLAATPALDALTFNHLRPSLYPPLDKAIAFIVTMVIALCWLWGPLAIFLITPKHFDQYLDPVIRFLRKHGGQLMGAVFFLVGIYLFSRGVIGLTAL